MSWKITPLYFLSQAFIIWTKRARRSEIFRHLIGWVKIHQIPYVMFETTSQFFFKLHHTSVSWEITLLYFFSWICTWFGQKEPIKVQNFRFSTAQCKISPNLHFHRLLLLKVHKVLAKKVQKSYASWPWILMQNLKKN